MSAAVESGGRTVTARLTRVAPRPLQQVVLCYLAAVGAAEGILVGVGPVAGTACHALLLLGLLNHYLLVTRAPRERSAAASCEDVLVAMALVPLLRILSLTMPVPDVGELYWYLLIGAPLLVALALAASLPAGRRTTRSVGLRWSPAQAAISLSGIPLGLVAFLILEPAPLGGAFSLRRLLVGSAILFVFVGFTEELLFRGLLQRALTEVFGAVGPVVGSAFFAIVYIGSLSAAYVIFMAGVGLLFGWCVSRTHSLLGVSAAHGFLSVGLILVWPLLLK